ncbi:LamG-like jellyroll fold domain-containing protein [Dactylosporangium sp. NPDC005572]|uniref:LamG-like jellyroll fold domain-containing protein n=1 Tax=Dactylosporangium sp. NPDC005572 TaxID=3156889 RepID=UPI0033B96413
MATESSYQSISLWFKTTATNGVLFSYQKDVVAPGATTTNTINPALYIDNTGKLRGSFWMGSTSTIVTTAAVNNGQWHHAVLAGNGGSQQLYLDGSLVGTLAGTIQMHNRGDENAYLGAGYLSNAWPGSTLTTPTATFFNGQIADAAYYNKPLTQQHVTMLYNSGTNPTPAMTKVTSNAGRTRAIIGYDSVSGRVNQVTDEAGGVWQVGQPTVSGSSQVYASSVLGSRPREYFRLNDISLPTQAVSQVRSIHNATYNNVTFNTTQPNTTSPFSDSYGAAFNGTSSYLRYDQSQAALPNYGPNSIELWFKTPANYASSGVLYSYMRVAVDGPNPAESGWVPALYVGGDGYLRGSFWTGDGVSPITSTTKVNDGNWHHVVLSATGPDNGSIGADTQTLYLDNVRVGTKSGWMEPLSFEYAYIGAGTTHLWPGSTQTVSYFQGNIAEFAFYERQGLSAAEVDAHFKAAQSAKQAQVGAGPTLTPVTTVTTTDPGNKTSRKVYDALNTSRLIASTDTLGNTTSYGYDVGGFVNVVYDPLGQKTETAKDVRGNTIRVTTCSNQDVGLECQDKLFTYWPDATTVNLAPDGRNDQLISVYGDTGSFDMALGGQNSFTYDTAGNRLTMTGPPVADFPTGRTTTLTYTTATTAAIGGGFTPPGLPLTVTSAGGAVQRTDYNAAGDAVKVTDAGGLVIEFTYDGLGRVKQQKVLAPGYPSGLITTYTYDPDGQPVEITEPATTNAVTGAVHTTRTTDTFDADGNVLSRTVSDLTGGDSSRVVISEYNGYGQLVKSVNPMGAVTLYGYDAYGRQNSMVNCDSSPAAGSPCPSGDRLQSVAQTFDSEGKLLTSTTTGEDGTNVQETSNAYYANGNLATTTDAMDWTTKYEYYDDSSLKRVTKTDGVKTTVVREHTYDFGGHPKSTIQNNGATKTDFSVDNAGRVMSQSVVVDGTTRSTNFVYDADDRVIRTRQTAGNQNTVLADTRNTYDAMGRLTSERTAIDAAGGPVGWWTMGGQSPTNNSYFVADMSGSQHHIEAYSADLVNGPTVSGGYANFRGGSLDTETPVLNTTGSYSVSAWVKLNSITGFQTAVAQTGNNHGAFFLQYSQYWGGWALHMPSSDSASPATYYGAKSTNALVANQWVHLVGVFDGNTKRMSIYVNNVRGTDSSNPTPFNSTGGLEIGGANVGGISDSFNGSIDNVQVYQRALTDGDVNTLWSSGNGRTNTAVANSPELSTYYTVDQRGLVTDMVDPNGNTTSYKYDEDGNLTESQAPSVTVESYGTTGLVMRPTTKVGYNAFGEAVEQQDPLGNVTQARMDANGRPWKTILPSYTPPGGSPIVDASSTTVYDKLGRVTSTTNPLGKTTAYEYDTLGNVTKVTGPTGKITTAKYDKVGDLVETVDPTGAKTTATYDYLGRKLTSTQIVRQPTTVSNTTTYDYGTGVYGTQPAAGPWLRKVTSPGLVTAEMTYNNAGEPVTSKDGAGNITTTTYDGLGRPIIVKNADNTATDMLYDGAGRTTRTRQFDNANNVLASQFAGYDDNGNLRTVKDGRGNTTTLTYDALNQVNGETQPITATTSINTSFGYDAAGHQTRFTDGRSNQFWTTFNTWGLPESYIEPATSAHPAAADRTYTTVYDAGGRAVTQALPGGVQLTNTYDDLNQVTGQSGTGAEASTVARSFGYDDAGRITSLSVPGGTNTVTYDDRGLPLSITGPADATAYTYNNDGNMVSRTDAAGATNFTYDTAGRLKTAANATTNINLSVAYNTMNQPSTITYGANNKKRTFTYDLLHRVTNDTVTSYDGTVTQGNIAYEYDLNNNITKKTTTGFTGASVNSYSYNFADRLTSWTSGSTTTNYAYDASGNRTQNGAKTFSYDQRNRLLSQSGGTSYSYTPRGTLSVTSGPGGVYNTTADAFGQVITQQAAGGNRTYDYDAVGRAVKAGFKYSGLGNDLADDGTTKYARGPAGELLGAADGGGTIPRYVWTDLHTDVVGQFSATSSGLTGSAAYDPLGTVLAKTGLIGRLGYQSEFTEQATGRVNMLARWYNTDTGQFDTRDTASNNPVPASINANRYQYGDGNPLTTTDPTGHWGFSLKSAWNAVKSVAAPAVNAATSAFNYVASGQAWQDVKAASSWVADKAVKATKAVVDSSSKWVQKKVSAVRDKVNDVKKCMSGGVTKCVKDTAKAAGKAIGDTVKNTVKAIREDPWKFIATAAVSIAATVAVGALCATGVGCLIVAGAVAGALSSGTGYMIDVGRGDAEFSWSGLADTMIQGGLDGALSAGVDKFTGGASKYMGKGASAAMPKLFGGGGSKANLPNPTRASSAGGGGRPGASAPSGRGGGSTASGGSPSRGGSASRGGAGGSSGDYVGRHRAPDCKNSFDPSTHVLMANGSTKRIEDVKVGDWVIAANPDTGSLEAKRVEVLHSNQDTDLTDLTITVERGDADETEVLQTTWRHPFWDETSDAWTAAQDLKRGDRVRTADGSVATIVAVANRVGVAEMLNLTIADLHTYYVIVANVAVLVHNCGETLDRAEELYGTRDKSKSSVAVARVRPIGSTDPADDRTWIATEQPGLPKEWDSRRGGTNPFQNGEEYIDGPGHGEQVLNGEMIRRGYWPIEVASSTNMCLARHEGCFELWEEWGLVPSQVGARSSNTAGYSDYRLMVRPGSPLDTRPPR